MLGWEGTVFLKSEEAPGQGSRWLIPGPPPWGRGGLAGGRPVPSAEGRRPSSGRASASGDVGAKRSRGQSVWGRRGVGPLTGQAGQGSDPGWPRGKVTSVGQAWTPRPLTLSRPSPYITPHPILGLPDIPPLTLSTSRGPPALLSRPSAGPEGGHRPRDQRTPKSARRWRPRGPWPSEPGGRIPRTGDTGNETVGMTTWGAETPVRGRPAARLGAAAPRGRDPEDAGP